MHDSSICFIAETLLHFFASACDNVLNRTSLILCDATASVFNHTHTHNHFTALWILSRISRVSWYQKGKTNLDFTVARDSEWQWHQLGHMQICTSPQTDNHASTPPLSFLQAGCPSCHPTNSIKSLKACVSSHVNKYLTYSLRMQPSHCVCKPAY